MTQTIKKLANGSKLFKVDLSEIILFYFLFFIVLITVYFLPYIFNQILFLVILIISFNSKKNYFWLSFVFFLINQPGTLFKGGWGAEIRNIASFNVMPNVSFSFFDLFIVFLFIKAIKSNKKCDLTLKKPLIFLLIYLIIIFSYSFIFDFNFSHFTSYLRLFTTFSLFYSIPILVTDKNEYYRLAHLLMPSIIFIIITQLFTLFTGKFFISNFVEYPTVGYFRPSGLKGIEVFMILILSTLLLIQRDHKENKIYLHLIQGLCLFSFFISATRSWIIVSIVFILYYLLKIQKNAIETTFKLIFIFLSLLFITIFSPKIKSGFSQSFQRLSTIGLLASGKTEYVEAGFSEDRIKYRLPKVLKAFFVNPIIGVGFGPRYQELGEITGDYHVGNFNMLANSGIFGFALFVLFWMKYIFTLNKIKNKISKSNKLYYAFPLFLIAFICLLIMHFTSNQMFGYTISQNKIVFLVLFICLSDKIIRISFGDTIIAKIATHKNCLK